MDVDAVADELYGLRPDRFTAARAQRAAAARTAGDRELADKISAMRRPSLSAWSCNLLVRERSDEIQPLVQLGEALRQAHQELDGEQLRRLAGQQQALIRALAQQAERLAADAGHPLGEGARQEVRDTLQAVLSDPDAAREWAAGRLTKALSPAVGFPAVPQAPAAQPKAPPRGSQPRAKATEPREADRADDAARRRREKQLTEARRAAEDAGRDLSVRETEAAEAARVAQEAAELAETLQQRVGELRRRIGELTEELGSTEDEQRRARAAGREARERERAARKRLSTARARAQKAADELERQAGADGRDG
ncbi:hypothetical protein ACWERY_39305 [Streptomyces sp. NPDC004082]|uniref:hypothetical protein n=1 Tax=unclassified Streptomyces TaxID=2593676 RepID=UPI0033BBB08F